MLIAALFTVAKEWKQPRHPSSDMWTSAVWHLCVRKCYSAIKRNYYINT